MNCNELVDLITDYLEESLPPDEAGRFDEHLGECGHCRRYLEQMRVTIQVAGKLDAERLPEKAVDDLMEAFSDWVR